MRAQSVILVAPSAGLRRSFDLAHAERLLRMRDSRWELPSDSGYTFSRAAGLTRKPAQGMLVYWRLKARNSRILYPPVHFRFLLRTVNDN